MYKKLSPLSISCLFLAFLTFPFFLPLKYTSSLIGYGLLLYLVFFITVYILYVRQRAVHDHLDLLTQEVRERQNVSELDISRLIDLKTALEKKIRNYRYLEKFTEALNNEISLDHICDLVVGETFALYGAKDNVLLYLVNEKSRQIELKVIKKEDPAQKVKEKTGDLFDHWVLRHNQPLLVEATNNDFRFDPDKIRELSRPIGSLICVPLMTDVHSLGIFRIDSPVIESYDADDLRFLSVIADIAKLAIENAIYFQHTKDLSITDALTGVALRRFFFERLKEEFVRAQRESAPLSFLMLDIDHFKTFNDRFGHMGGDVVLKNLAQWIKMFFNFPGSLVGRYGGEEFSVILPHIQKKEAQKLAESFREFLKEKDLLIRRHKVGITVSIGIADFPQDATSAEDLIHRADDALLRAKREGRDRICSF